MLANVPLRDFKNFKPDVVICPHCTQHLMGVRDIHWGADKVEFTYGCDGCGNELGKTIAEGAASEPVAFAPAIADHSTPFAVSAAQESPAPIVEDYVPFPFRSVAPKPVLSQREVSAAAKAEQGTYVPRQTFIEDRATRSPRQVFDKAEPVPEQETPTIASRASVLLRDVTIFNL